MAEVSHELNKFAWAWGPNPKARQWAFNPHKYSVMAGGIRSSKTTAACRRGIYLSLAFPGNVGLICRLQSTQLEISTTPIFKKELAKINGGEVEGGLVRSWDKAKNILTFYNGSKIYFRHLDKPETIQGSEWGWIYLDECHEIPHEAYLQLKPRLTLWNDSEADLFCIDEKRVAMQREFLGNTKPIKPKAFMFITQNPHPGWTKQEFKDNIHGEYHLVEITTRENEHYLGKGYVDDLIKTMPQVWVERFIDGSWEVAGGAIYKEFATESHVIEPFEIPAHWDRVIGMDFGWRNPTALVWIAIDEYGNLFAYDEHKASELMPSQHATAIKLKSRGIERIAPYSDPAGNNNSQSGRGSLFEEYRQQDIFCRAADNDVDAGLARVSEYLHIDPSHTHPITKQLGSPRFFIFRGACPELTQEMLNYEWEMLPIGAERNDPERPKKYNDHLMDALRYALMSRPRPSDILVKEEPDLAKAKAFIDHVYGESHDADE